MIDICIEILPIQGLRVLLMFVSGPPWLQGHCIRQCERERAVVRQFTPGKKSNLHRELISFENINKVTGKKEIDNNRYRKERGPVRCGMEEVDSPNPCIGRISRQVDLIFSHTC